MKLDHRQKILVGILGGTLALFWVVPIIWSIVFGPFTAKYTELAALTEKLNEWENSKHKLELAERRMAEADRRSLPSDPSSLAYQVWLMELANQHHFTALGVAPKSSSRNGNEPFSRIRFTVTGHSKMKDLCQFLYDFYRADLMHKVTNLAVKSIEAKSDPELEVSIDIEGLSMTSTKKRDSLFEGKQAQSVAVSMSKKTFGDFDLLHTQNHFSRGYGGPPKPTIPPAPPTPPFDSSPYVKFVGFVEQDGVAEAWLYDQTANKNTILKAGTDFEIAGVKAKVVEVAREFITLKIKEKTWRVEQGDSLKQMREVGSDGKPVTAPTATTATSTGANPTVTTETGNPAKVEASKTEATQTTPANTSPNSAATKPDAPKSKPAE
ncbi:MAG: hypothetical protein JWM11_7649 [Planctomycetaceae bacterium]|nr:hypothetical protein [Planctomycetaceae bacterium]